MQTSTSFMSFNIKERQIRCKIVSKATKFDVPMLTALLSRITISSVYKNFAEDHWPVKIACKL